MADITKNIVQGEICTLKISVAEYDESDGSKKYGTDYVNLTAKDIYVDFYSSDSETPVLSKDRISDESDTGVTIDEDQSTKSNLLIAFSADDYAVYPAAGFHTNNLSERTYEMRVRYKLLSGEDVVDEKSIYPYVNEQGQLVRYYINLIEKVQT